MTPETSRGTGGPADGAGAGAAPAEPVARPSTTRRDAEVDRRRRADASATADGGRGRRGRSAGGGAGASGTSTCDALAARCRPTSRTTRSGSPSSSPSRSARAAASLVDKLLPVLDALDLARTTSGTPARRTRAQGTGRAAGACCSTSWRRRASSGSTARGAASTRRSTRRSAHADGRGRRAHGPVRHCVDEVMRAGYRWQGPGACVPADGPTGAGTDETERRWRHSANGSRRTTTRSSGSPHGDRQGDHAAPTGSWPRSTTPTPTRVRERFKEISAAYDVLGDADKRKEYDEVRAMGPVAGGFGGGFRAAVAAVAAPSGWRTWVTSATCSAACSVAARRTRRPGRAPAGRRRRDRAAPVLRGRRARASPPRSTCTTDARCHTCRGSGAAPGTRPDTCPRCGGTGSSRTTRGCSPSVTICPQCSGRGTHRRHTRARPATGTGIEHRNRSVKVRMPAGVEDGQRIRVKGTGRGRRGRRSRRRPLRGRPGGPARASSGARAAT